MSIKLRNINTKSVMNFKTRDENGPKSTLTFPENLHKKKLPVTKTVMKKKYLYLPCKPTKIRLTARNTIDLRPFRYGYLFGKLTG